MRKPDKEASFRVAHGPRHLKRSDLQNSPHPVSSIHEKERNGPDWNSIWESLGEKVFELSVPYLRTVYFLLFSSVWLTFSLHKAFRHRLNKQSVLNRKCRVYLVLSHGGTRALSFVHHPLSVQCGGFTFLVRKPQSLSLIGFASWN